MDSKNTDSIKLTEDGDALLEISGSPMDDDSKLSGCIGLHALCYGFIGVRSTSATHKVLCCKGCFLRIPIPREVDTFGKLREHFSNAHSEAVPV